MTMTTPKHVELFIKSDGTIVAQCRTETAGRLDDPVSLQVGGDIWTQFKADWGAAKLAQIADLLASVQSLTAERDSAVSSLKLVQAELDALKASLIPGPRQVTPGQLLERISPELMVKIWNSGLPIAGIACATLFTWQGFIDLDSDRLTAILKSLEDAGLLSVDDVAKIKE